MNIKRCFYLLLTLVILASFNDIAKSAVVLQYHHISNTTPASTSTSPERFARHLDYLKANQFNVVSMETFAFHLATAKPFPDKSVLITFDDGYRSIYEVALPLLKKHGFPFTVFVNTRPLELKLAEFMNWQELQALQKADGTIANHSVSHPFMTQQLKGENPEQWLRRLEKEVVQAQNLLEDKLAINGRYFAYPYGEYNVSISKLIKRLGFLGFAQHSGAVASTVDSSAIPRFPMGGEYGEMAAFKLKVNTLPLPIKSLALLDENRQPLADWQLPVEVERPILKIELLEPGKLENFACYLSSQGRITEMKSDGVYLFQSSQPLTQGRSKYNCTAKAKEGRYYWFSQLWIKGQSSY